MQTRDLIAWVKKGRAPLPGSAGAYISSVSHDDAATALAAAIDLPSGTYNVVDDEPVTHRVFVDSLADALGIDRPKLPPHGSPACSGRWAKCSRAHSGFERQAAARHSLGAGTPERATGMAGRAVGTWRDAATAGFEGRGLRGIRGPAVEGRGLRGTRGPAVEGRGLRGTRRPAVEGRGLRGTRRPAVEGRGLRGHADQRSTCDVTTGHGIRGIMQPLRRNNRRKPVLSRIPRSRPYSAESVARICLVVFRGVRGQDLRLSPNPTWDG